jgi:hypothetical protein
MRVGAGVIHVYSLFIGKYRADGHIDKPDTRLRMNVQNPQQLGNQSTE